MKLVLETTTNKRIIRPSKDNIVLYDGKTWYVTTKQDLFKEYDERYATKIAECNDKIEEMNALKVEMAGQMLELQEMVKAIVLKEDK